MNEGLNTTDARTVSVVGDSHVSTLSPGSSPGVSKDVVVLPIRGSITDKSDCMVSISSTFTGVENST